MDEDSNCSTSSSISTVRSNKRSAEEPEWLKHFVINKLEGTSKCLLCTSEKKEIRTIYKHNLKKHLIKHKEEAIKYGINSKNLEEVPCKKKIKGINVEIDEAIYVKACVKLSTVDALPYSFFNYEGWKEISEPIERSLSTKINNRNITEKIANVACQLKDILKNELKDKMICLKFDGATRKGRSILGINAQYLSQGVIKIRSLDYSEVTKKHTGIMLRDEVMACLQKYDIDINKVYCCTTDNGRNMLKAVDLLKKMQSESVQAFIDETFSDDFQGISEADENILEDLIETALNPILTSVPCAAHTLQLAVNDALKSLNLIAEINKVRNVVKELRKQSYKTTFKNNHKRLPLLDVVTRWDSTYIMFDSLLENRNFISEIDSENILNISDNVWNFVEEFTMAFKSAHICTKILQEEQLVMGDLYKAWIQCTLNIKKINNKYSKHLLKALEIRKKKLFENDAFLAALYLDPRFNFDGSSHFNENDRSKAKVILFE
jgi:hypothetical protein